MRNILLPTDYSEYANNAFFYALNLANKFGVKLYVLYSYLPPILSSGHAGQPEMLTSVYQEIEASKHDYAQRKNQQLLAEATQQQLDTSHVHFLFEPGTVLSTVKKIIAEYEISLVVMGVHGAGASNQFMGSNTSSVIRNVPLPILAIPRHATYASIKKIGFTTLFKEKDLDALQQIMDIGAMVGACVHCIHVKDDSVSPADVLLHSEKWSKHFKDKNMSFEFLEKENSVEQTVNTYIIEKELDVLAIVRRNRNFFERLMSSSLSLKLTFHAEIPIFVFHEV
mgnify:CR=1 FL=1